MSDVPLSAQDRLDVLRTASAVSIFPIIGRARPDRGNVKRRNPSLVGRPNRLKPCQVGVDHRKNVTDDRPRRCVRDARIPNRRPQLGEVPDGLCDAFVFQPPKAGSLVLHERGNLPEWDLRPGGRSLEAHDRQRSPDSRRALRGFPFPACRQSRGSRGPRTGCTECRYRRLPTERLKRWSRLRQYVSIPRGTRIRFACEASTVIPPITVASIAFTRLCPEHRALRCGIA